MTQLIQVDGHATLPALHASDRSLIAGPALQPDRRRPCREHPLELGEVLGVGRHSQSLGDLFDEALPVTWTHLTEQLNGVCGQLEVDSVDPLSHAHRRPPPLRSDWLGVCQTTSVRVLDPGAAVEAHPVQCLILGLELQADIELAAISTAESRNIHR